LIYKFVNSLSLSAFDNKNKTGSPVLFYIFSKENYEMAGYEQPSGRIRAVLVANTFIARAFTVE